ncbi:MAG TPA: hypothetical protein VEA99_14805, partial [Gemmatimonadaceae bacterium]|nr:hypothetical protein [Gemmatimonadaceae bacterium]
MIENGIDGSGALRALESLGWDAQWAAAFAPHAAPGAWPVRVVAQHRESWVVSDGRADDVARAAGRLRHAALEEGGELPAVGDWVVVEGAPGAGGERRIVGILPRRGTFVRKEAGARTRAQVVAANVDLALVVTALPNDLQL